MFKKKAQTYYPNLKVYRLGFRHVSTSAIVYFWVPKQLKLSNLYVFDVSFVTIPHNLKGYPHITEHVVLHGNHKYVNETDDLFFELYSKTFASVLNASTMPRSTNYYAASFSFADMLNIFDVYYASLFEPLFTPEIVHHEGFYWRYDAKTEDFIPQGVIFNEMQQGRYTLDEARFRAYIKQVYPKRWQKKLIEFGGNPLEMAKGIDYNALLGFYKRYYSLNNAIFMFTGPFSKLQINRVLERLDALLSDTVRSRGDKYHSKTGASLNMQPIRAQPQQYKKPLIMYFEPSYTGQLSEVDIVLTLPVKQWAAVSVLQWLLVNECSPLRGLRSAKYFKDLSVTYFIEELLYFVITLKGVNRREYTKAINEFLRVLDTGIPKVSDTAIRQAKVSILTHLFLTRETNDPIDIYDLIDFANLVRLDSNLDFVKWFDSYIEDLKTKELKDDVLELLTSILQRRFNIVYYVPKNGITEQFLKRLNQVLEGQHKRILTTLRLREYYKRITEAIETKRKISKSESSQNNTKKTIPVLNVRNEKFKIPRSYVQQVASGIYAIKNPSQRFGGLLLEFDLTDFINDFGTDVTWLLLVLKDLLFKPEFYPSDIANQICGLKPYVPSFSIGVTTRKVGSNVVLPILVIRVFFDKSKYEELLSFVSTGFFKLNLEYSQQLTNKIISILNTLLNQDEDQLFRYSLYDLLESTILPENMLFSHHFGIYRLPDQYSAYSLIRADTKRGIEELLMKLRAVLSYLTENLRVSMAFGALQDNHQMLKLSEIFNIAKPESFGVKSAEIPGLSKDFKAVIGVYPMSNQYLRVMAKAPKVDDSASKRAKLLLLYNVLSHKRVLPYFRKRLTAYGGRISFNYTNALVSLYGYRMSSVKAVSKKDLDKLLDLDIVKGYSLEQFLPDSMRELLVRDSIMSRFAHAYKLFRHALSFEFVHDMWDALRTTDVNNVNHLTSGVAKPDLGALKFGVLTDSSRLKDVKRWFAEELGIDSAVVIDFQKGQIRIPE